MENTLEVQVKHFFGYVADILFSTNIVNRYAILYILFNKCLSQKSVLNLNRTVDVSK